MTEWRWPIGGLWDGDGLCIQLDEPMSRLASGSYFERFGESLPRPCPHATNIKTAYALDGRETVTRESWIVPRVLVMWNEAGHSTTACCADCVVDFVRSLEKE